MGIKNIILVMGLVFSTLIGGKAFAGVIEDTCAQNTPGFPAVEPPRNSANTAAVANYTSIMERYNLCVSESYRMQSEQAQLPTNPGTPPVYNCAQFQQPSIPASKYQLCRAEYEQTKAKYDMMLAAYQAYVSQHPNMNNRKELSAAQVLEDVAARQQLTADRLRKTAKTVRDIGIAMGLAGGALMLWTPTMPAGKIMIASGIGLTIISMVIQAKSDKIAREKIQSCEQMNKILTTPIACPDVKLQTAVDGIFTATNYGFNGKNGTSEIPAFIDPTSGKCKAPISAECAMLIKNSPKDCFKANSKGVSCMAGGKVKDPITVLANGKVSANINGKQQTFGLEDFADEDSMVNAGFTPAQAKQFLDMVNDPDSILAKNGLNAKGELMNGSGAPSSSFARSSSSGNGAGASVSEMKSKKDEYGPAQEVARTPASAEGLTKDYQGEKIGAEGDDVFKMINRRYILKQKQNIFLEQ